MKNIVGSPAKGENFYLREREIEKIVSRLEAGNNLQIAAPRRIGKTSILHYLKDNQVGGHTYVYLDTEQVGSSHEFYKMLLKTILKIESIANSRRVAALFEQGVKFFSKIKSVKVFGQGIDFSDGDQAIDYYEELSDFLCEIELERNKKLVLLIDEFPQTILSILEANNGNSFPAIQFLQSNRALRLRPELINKVQFVYTGSIGLNYTVSAIDASAFVNDLNSTEVEPLTVEEATDFARILFADKGITVSDEAIAYLLKKINWLIPFHIQLALQEIGAICWQTKMADIETMDRAFDLMVASRNHNHFEHYHSRLRRQFKGKELDYAEMVLEKVATDGKIDKREMYDQAVAYELKTRYRRIIEVLSYDGYINNNVDIQSYLFNSPLVRLWWQKFICN